MKHLLLTTIAAVVLVTTAFADAIHDAAAKGNLAHDQGDCAPPASHSVEAYAEPSL